MTTSKHTPGPWRVYVQPSDRWPGIEADRGISVVVYCGDDDFDNSGVQGATRDEALANANLIAAAPELLEALKEALYAVTEIDNAHQSLRQIRSAIAKAEGPTHESQP